MAHLLETLQYHLGTTLFRKRFFVESKATGSRIFPTPAEHAHYEKALQAIDNRKLTKEQFEQAVVLVSERFAAALHHPDEWPASTFFQTDPDLAIEPVLVAIGVYGDPPCAP